MPFTVICVGINNNGGNINIKISHHKINVCVLAHIASFGVLKSKGKMLKKLFSVFFYRLTITKGMLQ